jgi:hypothetical protein
MDTLEDRLDRIERKLDALLAVMKPTVTGGRPTNTAVPSNGNGPEFDVDIDGPRGDPEVRFVPKRWTGTDYKGQKFSACEPEFLDMLAEAYEWFAQRDDEANAVDRNGTPKSRWSRLDAARARAWAARLRGNGGTNTVSRAARAATPSNDRRAAKLLEEDNDIPF